LELTRVGQRFPLIFPNPKVKGRINNLDIPQLFGGKNSLVIPNFLFKTPLKARVELEQKSYLTFPFKLKLFFKRRLIFGAREPREKKGPFPRKKEFFYKQGRKTL